MNRLSTKVRRNRANGFSLIELMLALASGLFVILATYVLLNAMQKSLIEQTGVAETQSSGRLAILEIRDALWTAGYTSIPSPVNKIFATFRTYSSVTGAPEVPPAPLATTSPGGLMHAPGTNMQRMVDLVDWINGNGVVHVKDSPTVGSNSDDIFVVTNRTWVRESKSWRTPVLYNEETVNVGDTQFLKTVKPIGYPNFEIDDLLKKDDFVLVYGVAPPGLPNENEVVYEFTQVLSVTPGVDMITFAQPMVNSYLYEYTTDPPAVAGSSPGKGVMPMVVPVHVYRYYYEMGTDPIDNPGEILVEEITPNRTPSAYYLPRAPFPNCDTGPNTIPCSPYNIVMPDAAMPRAGTGPGGLTAQYIRRNPDAAWDKIKFLVRTRITERAVEKPATGTSTTEGGQITGLKQTPQFRTYGGIVTMRVTENRR